tara:strand:- start:5467 stop:6375 length:909 start_codon:yes stop_codon:yes gene_type:complete
MKRTKTVFLALAILAGLQMIWWAYLVVAQQNELAQLSHDPQAISKAISYQRMILFEALFFLFVWSLGIFYVYRSFRREQVLQEERKTFLDLITHDLKTPLSNIQISLESLQRDDLKAEMRQNFINRAINGVSNLNQQIDKILRFNSLDKKQPKEKLNLKDLIEDCKKDWDMQATYHLELENVNIMASNEEVRAILQNILSNAVKYSSIEKPAEVYVNLKYLKNKARLTIKDNGIGFTSKELDLAFQPFWRGETAKTKAINGSGIGLGLAKELCRKNNAKIQIHSEGKNQGSTIAIDWYRVLP